MMYHLNLKKDLKKKKPELQVVFKYNSLRSKDLPCLKLEITAFATEFSRNHSSCIK